MLHIPFFIYRAILSLQLSLYFPQYLIFKYHKFLSWGFGVYILITITFCRGRTIHSNSKNVKILFPFILNNKLKISFGYSPVKLDKKNLGQPGHFKKHIPTYSGKTRQNLISASKLPLCKEYQKQQISFMGKIRHVRLLWCSLNSVLYLFVFELFIWLIYR